MSIIVEQLTAALNFRLLGDTYVAAKTWEDAIDDRVFDHELATGQTPRGFPLDDSWLLVARYARKQNVRVPPWYATIQGAYSYTFQFAPEGVMLRCANSETGDTLELVDPSPIVRPRPAKSNTMPYMSFLIDGASFRRLVAWEHWSISQAQLSRYQYRFVPTTVIGIITVSDSEAGTEIDITDYGEAQDYSHIVMPGTR